MFARSPMRDMLKRPFDRSPALTTPATQPRQDPSTGETAITVRKRKFTILELWQFSRIISTAEAAVRAVRTPDAATDEDRRAVTVLTNVGLISEEMNVKQKRKVIGELWRAAEKLIEGHGIEVEWVNPLNSLYVAI